MIHPINRIDKTADLHQNGGLNCSQALLTAYGDRVGLDAEKARALGRPLSGGFAQSAHTCGYLVAAAMILSLANHADDEKRIDFHGLRLRGSLRKRGGWSKWFYYYQTWAT